MSLAFVVMVLLLLAVCFQIAVDRAPDLPDSDGGRSARRVLVVGLTVLFLYMLHLCLDGVPVSPLPLVGLLLVSLGEIAFCVARLFPNFVRPKHSARAGKALFH